MFKFRFLKPTQKNKVSFTSSPLSNCVDNKYLLPPEKLVRLGTAYGGWLLPIDFLLTMQSVCYCIGAGEDISFDCALAKKFHANIRIVDPTPKAIEHFKNLECAVASQQAFAINNSSDEFYDITQSDFARIRFLPYGLADTDVEQKFYKPKNPDHVSCSVVNLQKTDDYFIAQCYTLRTLMRQCGDTQLDLLKMDIEGGEYAVIKNLVEMQLLPRLFLIEFDETHTPLDDRAGHRIQTHINLLLDAGMQCIALDDSNAVFLKKEL
jgi:FkbM family methyltransferase